MTQPSWDNFSMGRSAKWSTSRTWWELKFWLLILNHLLETDLRLLWIFLWSWYMMRKISSKWSWKFSRLPLLSFYVFEKDKVMPNVNSPNTRKLKRSFDYRKSTIFQFDYRDLPLLPTVAFLSFGANNSAFPLRKIPQNMRRRQKKSENLWVNESISRWQQTFERKLPRKMSKM